MSEVKNPAAVELGRLGGKKGGKARAEKLSAKERAAIARKAAKARWDKKRREEEGSQQQQAAKPSSRRSGGKRSVLQKMLPTLGAGDNAFVQFSPIETAFLARITSIETDGVGPLGMALFIGGVVFLFVLLAVVVFWRVRKSRPDRTK